jgi:hypothetical protein
MHRVSRFNTVLRSICTIAIVAALAQAAAAQSVQSTLNFTGTAAGDAGPASVAITNSTSNFADVQFTLYNSDGTLASAPLNPVSYRVAPKAQISKKPDEIFGAHRTGWVQATSLTPGLEGFYFVGDFKNTLDGAEAPAVPALTQVIPLLANGNILITNPGGQAVSVAAIFYDEKGAQSSTPQSTVPSHGQILLPMRPGSAARLIATSPVIASATTERSGSIMMVNGQDDRLLGTRIIPHFVSGNGTDTTVVLTNPTPTGINVTVRVYNADSPSALQASVSFPIAGFQTISRNWADLYGRTPTPIINNGWVRIDPQGPVALDGMAIVDSSAGLTAVPMQSAPLDRILFSRTQDDQDLFSQLEFVTGDSLANVTVTLMRADGATLGQVARTVAANSKILGNVRDWIPTAATLRGSFIVVRSSAPVYGVEIINASTARLLATVTPQPLAASFVPTGLSAKISGVSDTTGAPTGTVQPGMKLRVSVVNAGDNLSFVFGGQSANATISPIGAWFDVEVPQIDPGYVTLRVRAEGAETDSWPLRVADTEGALTETLRGRAFYQKVAVTDAGLDLTQTVMVPIRNARVEVFDKSLNVVVSVSETDGSGQFTIAAPNQSDLVVRVFSRLRGLDLRVADNTNGNALYNIASEVDAQQQQSDVMLVDVNSTPQRVSGAFNILEAIQRGNDLIAKADPRIVPPSFTMFWSVRNTNKSGNPANGLVGGTFFNLSTGTAFILGDRATDSDEFDDSVLLHEYAHVLAVRFSRDDSPGGSHSLGDYLDPRVAWSEAWANFFSSAARNNPVYRDSYGPNGVNVLRYFLEDNDPSGNHPGIWSEASIQSLLWDLFDDASDDGDSSQFDFSLIWSAFADLRNDHFVYLPYFLDHFIERNPESADIVRVMAQLRSIQFLPGMRPSVSNPFPRLLTVGQTVTGEVDSLTTKRTNLMSSSHFYSFTTSGGATGIRLDIAGFGPGNSANANDLDLYLLDLNGRIIAKSNTSDPRGELIKGITLAAGAFVVEVRSYYTNASTGAVVYNSGQYNLIVNVQ